MSDRKCYGNYMIDGVCEGHHDCKEYGCFGKTSIDKGACDCKYKSWCHLFRQQHQYESRMNPENPKYTKVEQCWFYISIDGIENEKLQSTSNRK